MWVLESFSRVVAAGPFKSEAEMAKKLGVSQQYVNQQIRKGKAVFNFEGEKVIATRETKFVASGTKITAKSKEDLALKLGVSQDAVEKVLRKKTSGIIQTPKGEVKIQRLKPGEKPILPAVRVLWNDDTTPKQSQRRSKLGEIRSCENLMGKNSRLKSQEKKQG